MKKLLRWAFRLLILLVILLAAAVLLLNTVARIIVERQLRAQTGLGVKIGSVDIGLLSPYFSVKNLIIYNDADFGGTPMMELPELRVEYDLAALRTHQLHCKLVELNLAKIYIVEDKNGRKNFETLQSQGQVAAPVNGNGPLHASSPGLQFTGVDKLILTLGKATYRRMQQPDQVKVLDLNVNHQQFSNLKNEQDLQSALLVALLRSGVNLMQSDDAQTWLQLFAPKRK